MSCPPEPETTFAVVKSGHEQRPATLMWGDLGAYAGSGYINEVSGIYRTQVYRNPDGRLTASPDCDRRLVKAINRNIRSSVEVSRFFGLENVTDQMVDRPVLCGIVDAQSSSRFVSFVAGLLSSQYIHHPRVTRSVMPHIADFDEINFVSGPCLFSKKSVQAVGADGSAQDILDPRGEISQPIHRIEVDDRLSIYELETTARLCDTIEDLAGLLPTQVRVAVRMDIPRVQYYCRLLDAFADNLIAPHVLLQWFDMVDNRHTQLKTHMSEELSFRFRLLPAARQPKIGESPGLNVLAEFFHAHVASGRVPVIADACAVLASDEVWREVLLQRTIKSFRDLGMASYIVEQIRSGTWTTSGPTRLALIVEDHPERNVYDVGLEIASAIGNHDDKRKISLVGLYPLGRVTTSVFGTRSTLHFDDPGHEFASPWHNLLPADVIRSLYSVRHRQGREGAV